MLRYKRGQGAEDGKYLISLMLHSLNSLVMQHCTLKIIARGKLLRCSHLQKNVRIMQNSWKDYKIWDHQDFKYCCTMVVDL